VSGTSAAASMTNVAPNEISLPSATNPMPRQVPAVRFDCSSLMCLSTGMSDLFQRAARSSEMMRRRRMIVTSVVIAPRWTRIPSAIVAGISAAIPMPTIRRSEAGRSTKISVSGVPRMISAIARYVCDRLTRTIDDTIRAFGA